MHIVFRSSGTYKIQDRCKSWQFGQASQTRMTCTLTTAKDTNYGLPHALAPNKRPLNIDIDTRNPGKITKGSKSPCGHYRRDAKNHCVHQHSQKLHSTLLKRSTSYMLYQWMIFIECSNYSKEHNRLTLYMPLLWHWFLGALSAMNDSCLETLLAGTPVALHQL